MTNIKLDDTWRGTNESFLMHYNDQLRLLDSLVDSGEKLPDNPRVTFLESAIESVPDLQRVKITDNVLQAQLGSTRPISYRSYFDLLKDAAFHLDQATKRGNKTRCTNVHFSGPNDEDAHHNLSADDNQVIQPENVWSEPPESLSYSLFQSHFQGSSTPNTQKIFLPKPIWEKLSKDQQQMIIDHNRSLPESGSTHLSTPNKSPSPLPHKPTPQQTAKSQQVHTHQSDEGTTDTTKTETTPSDPLLAMVHQSIHTSDDDASDISNVLSVKRSCQIQVCQRYLFQHANHTNQQLVDRGANGGLAGSDMHVIPKTDCKINIQGIDNHEVTGLDVVTAATFSSTPLKGKSLAYSMNMPTLGRDHPFIHQVNLSGLRPMLMKNLSKLVVPNLSLLWMDILSLSSSRMVWPMPPPLENPQIRTWTHIHMFFSPLLMNGIPQSLTMILHTLMDWTPVKSLNNLLVTPCLMPMEISMRASLPTSTSSWMHLQKIVGHTQKSLLFSQPISIRVHPKSLTGMPYAHSLHGHPHPASRTLSMSPPGMGLLHIPRITSKKHFKSRNPVFNIPRCSEAVATDTIFSDTPAVDDGSTMAQFFCGHDTLVCDAYGIKSTKQFINTLSDNIRKRGAMDTLISDGGKYEISHQVTDLLRSLFIQDYQSEPYHQHQNKTENHFGLAKHYTNTVMNTSGCPAFCWLLCLQYICVVLNHFASPTLQGICPVQGLQGTTPDVRFMLHFSFYEPVYYRIDSSEPDLNFLHHPMKRKVIGLVLLTTKVTVSPGGSSLRILTRLSFVLAFAVLSELQQTSVLHHLQGRGPHLLFPFLILNNLQILCHLTLLMHQPPILSNLSKVSLVKMKIIQSPWPTLTFPIFLADPSFYHLRIMGSATWPKSLTLMTMDNLLKTLDSS